MASYYGDKRLSGHGLVSEGVPHDDQGERIWGPTEFGHEQPALGRGKCSCGSMSEPTPTRAARKRWHRDHKDQVVKDQMIQDALAD